MKSKIISSVRQKGSGHEHFKNNFKIVSKNIIPVIVLTALLFTSCKKEEIAEAPPTEEIAADTTAVAAVDSVAPATTNQPATNSVMTSSPQATAQSYTTTTPAPTAKGMNPPHGQPGHRCDIAVGAPLNSAPKQTAPITGSATITPATTVTTAMRQTADAPPANEAPVVTAPGMNPPHGQPGHLCSIAVGAPLPKN